jgi:hypothetical protein
MTRPERALHFKGSRRPPLQALKPVIPSDLEGYTQIHLDISTCHLTDADATLLGQEYVKYKNKGMWFAAAPILAEYDEGWFLYVPYANEEDWVNHVSEMRAAGYTSLIAVLSFARDHDIGIVRLDSDADMHPDLETYEW